MSDWPFRRDLCLSHDCRSSRRCVLRHLDSYFAHELLQTPFKNGTLQHDATSATLTAQSNVGAEACDFPIGAAAGMRFAQAEYVAKAEFEDD